jgi:hypothetical protein
MFDPSRGDGKQSLEGALGDGFSDSVEQQVSEDLVHHTNSPLSQLIPPARE